MKDVKITIEGVQEGIGFTVAVHFGDNKETYPGTFGSMHEALDRAFDAQAMMGLPDNAVLVDYNSIKGQANHSLEARRVTNRMTKQLREAGMV